MNWRILINSPWRRIRQLRGDDSGQVLLLSAVMVFVVAIMGVIAMDSNMAVYNRIVAQNATDAAADAAALWQARGCNLLQHLNNLHYGVDIAACIGESIAAAACAAGAVLVIVEKVPIIGAAAAAARPAVCIACDLLPIIDAAQQKFYEILMPIQQGIVDVTPFLAFGYANAAAKGSGADELLPALAEGLEGLLGKLGLSAPGFGDIAGAIAGGLDWVPLYAAPINPSSLKLYVEKKSTDDLPWDYPSWVGEAGDIAGQIGCSDYGYPSAKNIAKGMGWDEEWGWDDQYFFGNPGFMTWIAAKRKRGELAGLGKLRWMNGGEQNEDQISKVMYTGSALGSGKLEIPAFIAIASSQVEGTPVVSHGDVDAHGKLIKVYLSESTPGESFWIFH